MNRDIVDGRMGEWMHTSMGNKFFPADPRIEDIRVTDIANGLALCNRYGGQNRIDRFYSVAEHCVHMARYALMREGWPAQAAMGALFHDAAEGYLTDLPRAVKHAVGEGYEGLEERLQNAIEEKYGLALVMHGWGRDIKMLDQRIVPLEKAAIMRYPQPWAHDQFEPLEGVTIQCWSPRKAKAAWLAMYEMLCKMQGLTPEEWEI
jgi:uncharacterized protein